MYVIQHTLLMQHTVLLNYINFRHHERQNETSSNNPFMGTLKVESDINNSHIILHNESQKETDA